jgi:hypothetical protein
MRSLLSAALSAAVLSISGVAFGATVTLDRPTQGETASSGTLTVSVSLSQDFQAGRDGWVEIWVDGVRAITLKGTRGQVNLKPGDHLIQARLVNLQHAGLRVRTYSDQVTVTVPTVDPHRP